MVVLTSSKPKATPTTATPTRPAGRRDPFIDVVRVAAIVLVVLQHWLMPVLSFDGTHLVTGNSYSTPGWWAFTWAGQVMPLVFFAGGAAGFLSYQAHRHRGGGDASWVAGRVSRLARPVLPLAAVWVPLPYLLLMVGIPADPLRTAAAIVPQLLWFLVVYLLAVATLPAMVRLHVRFGTAVPIVMAGGAVLTDVVRFSLWAPAGYLNIVFVWLAVHQLGFFYAQRGATFLSRPAATAVGGYGLLALMVLAGPYPASMLGLPGAAVSNMNPPTACLLALAGGQLGLLMMLRPAVLRVAQRTRVANVLTELGARTMTLYLWHMTALVTVAGALVLGLGVNTPAPGSAAWLLGVPFWLVTLGAALALLSLVFARYEQPRPAGVAASGGRVAAGTVLVAAGLLTLVVRGFAPPAELTLLTMLTCAPVFATVTLGVGLRLVHSRQATSSPRLRRL